MMKRITEWFKTALLALFVIELLVFIAVAKYIGLFLALILIIASSYLGFKVLHGQFASSIINLRNGMQSGYFFNEYKSGSGLTTLGGILLVIPGFVTDILGLLCLIPAIKQRLFATNNDQPEVVEAEEGDFSSTVYTKSSRVIEGEFVREKNTEDNHK